MERRAFLTTIAGAGALGSVAGPAAARPQERAQDQAPQAARTRVPRAVTMYGMPAVADLSQLDADVAFLGVPYDLGHTLKPGTKLGPAAIREGSAIAGPFTTNSAGFYDRETGTAMLEGVRLVDAGDVPVPAALIEPVLDNVTADVTAIIGRTAMPVVIGGDHSITFAAIRGLRDLGRRIHIVHFDAHHDFAPKADRLGGRIVYDHGNHLRHAIELPFVSGITMLGLRGLARGAGATAADVRAHAIDEISASQIRQMGPAAAVARIPAADAYYVTIDIDVLDPAIAPATGTPVPGGLLYYELAEILEGIASRGRLAGFDLMEVSPPYDANGATSMLAAYVILRFLGAAFQHQKALRRS
jgi:agmatinase